jgi:hypothetical protein
LRSQEPTAGVAARGDVGSCWKATFVWRSFFLSFLHKPLFADAERQSAGVNPRKGDRSLCIRILHMRRSCWSTHQCSMLFVPPRDRAAGAWLQIAPRTALNTFSSPIPCLLLCNARALPAPSQSPNVRDKVCRL